MSDFNTCDLCKKNEAVHLFTLVKGKRAGEPVAVCWKCPSGVPDVLLDDLVYAVEAGTSPKLAAMFITGQGPTVHTDDTWTRGWKNDGAGQFAKLPPVMREEYLRPARQAGVSVQGKLYYSELAAFPGDPRAWVGSKADAVNLLRERRWTCEELGVKSDRQEPAPAVVLAEDIVQARVADQLAEVPEADRTPRMVEDAREAVINRHAKKKEIIPHRPGGKRGRFRDFVKT